MVATQSSDQPTSTQRRHLRELRGLTIVLPATAVLIADLVAMKLGPPLGEVMAHALVGLVLVVLIVPFSMGITRAFTRMYTALAERSAAAERAGQLHEEFAAQVAHDLLNPLTVINGVAQVTLRRLDRQGTVDPAQLQGDMRTIADAVTKATNEVRMALELARTHAGRAPVLEVAQTDLVDLADEAIEEARRLSTRHSVVLESEQAFISGEWDSGRLLHALNNLLGNAIKYSPNGGRIIVALRTEVRDAREWAVVDVRDNGMGIPSAALPRIFERFYRAENTENIAGTGLGLSGVQQIVEAHGGTVGVQSVEGQGSTFTICLPTAPSAMLETAASASKIVASTVCDAMWPVHDRTDSAVGASTPR